MRLPACVAVVTVLLTAGALAVEVPLSDVLLKAEIEAFGKGVALQPLAVPDASQQVAMQLHEPTSGVWGGAKLAPGEYTLLFRVWAPAGDQDGFFVDIRDKRDRRVPPGQRKWHTMAYNFSVKQQENVALALVVQEIGFVVDQVALVKGTYKTNELRIGELPGETRLGPQIKPSELPRFSWPVQLAKVPEGPLTRDAATLLLQDFEADCPGARGNTRSADGRFGKALYVGVPDGRFVADTSGFEFGAEGTVELWVKPRPAQQLWSDQGWHYLIHCEPADGAGDKAFSLSLSRHPMTQLTLTAKLPGSEKSESLSVSTGGADPTQWHHVLVSWDMNAERQHLWLLVDGVGKHLEFTPMFAPTSFKQVELGNTPLSSDLPYLFLDGALDELHISKRCVRERLTGQ